MKSARRLLGLALRVVLLLVIEGLVILALAAILPGVKTPSFKAAVLVAAAMALINAVLWPIVIRVALPLTVFTFGLGSLVFSAGTVALGFYVVDGTSIPIGGDLAIAFAMALVSMLIAPLLDVDGDAQHLRVVRRRVRARRKDNRTDVPGVILFEIDGLGETILQGGGARRVTCPRSRAGCQTARTRSSAGSAISPRRRARARRACCWAATGTCPPSAGMRRSPGARSSPTIPPTRPRSSSGAPPARACSRTGARAGATCSPATRRAARPR